MSDNEGDPINDEPFLDDDNNAHQACYVFKPFQIDDLEHVQSAKKRRKTKSPPVEQPSPFPLLNHGNEPEKFAQVRHDTFQRLWTRKEARFRAIVDEADEAASTKIKQYINTLSNGSSNRLRTGLIVSGPDGSAQTRLLENWKLDESEHSSVVLVQLRASHCTNLQTVLKNIIRSTITYVSGLEGYQTFLNKHKKLIPMNFDLELLQIFVQEQKIQNIVLSMNDVETFNLGILSDLFSMLSSWSETIPFVMLLGIATTVDLFESRLPRSTINVLDATIFSIQSSADVHNKILQDLDDDLDQGIRFGPVTMSSLEEMTESQGTTIETLINAIRFVFMSHFFANSLSVLISDEALPTDKKLCEAIRNTPSFQQHCELLLSKNPKAAKEVSRLLSDDKTTLQVAIDAVKRGLKVPSTGDQDKDYNLPEAYVVTPTHLLNPFNPRPRYALERALSRPSDYLGCECCQNKDGTSANQAPPTSILYNLLQEAGTVINVRDLYNAFCARAFSDHTGDEEQVLSDKADRKQLSIFYSALAELKMLGLVKSNTSAIVKKRAAASSGLSLDNGVLAKGKDRYGDVDFIAKTGWIGL